MTQDNLKELAFDACFPNKDEGQGYFKGFDKCMELVVTFLEEYKVKGHTLYFDERDLFNLLKCKYN